MRSRFVVALAVPAVFASACIAVTPAPSSSTLAPPVTAAAPTVPAATPSTVATTIAPATTTTPAATTTTTIAPATTTTTTTTTTATPSCTAQTPGSSLATTTNRFDITVYARGNTACYYDEISAAVDKWEQILGVDGTDRPDVALNLAAKRCGTDWPARTTTADELEIEIVIAPIDGPYNTVGQAGPCLLRSGGAHNGLPVYGVMWLDSADVDVMRSEGRLVDVLTHEIGHIIGIGTISAWNSNVVNGSGDVPYESITPPPNNPDPLYRGVKALNVWQTTWGKTGRVPVEGSMGAGSSLSHWRESSLSNELMTPTLNSGHNPLSILTIRAVEDFGYTVDEAAAETYTLPNAAALRWSSFAAEPSPMRHPDLILPEPIDAG